MKWKDEVKCLSAQFRSYIYSILFWWINPTIRRMQTSLASFSFRLIFKMCQTHEKCFFPPNSRNSFRKWLEFIWIHVQNTEKYQLLNENGWNFLIFKCFQSNFPSSNTIEFLNLGITQSDQCHLKISLLCYPKLRSKIGLKMKSGLPLFIFYLYKRLKYDLFPC